MASACPQPAASSPRRCPSPDITWCHRLSRWQSVHMSQTTGEFILRRLIQWGVPRVYGYPGDGINGILGGFHQVGDELEFVQVRHEELASFQACAHAKLTGEVGVCLATSGPGAIHLLNGLY